MARKKQSSKRFHRKAPTSRARKPSEKDIPGLSTDTEQRRRPTFLNIPAELRNRIYEEVLLEKSKIMVTPSLREPGILQACRQTRAEAYKIWWLRNNFKLWIHNIDSSLLNDFLRYHSDVLALLKCEFDLSSRRDWSKLMLWCAGVHEVRSPYLQWTDDMDALETVVNAALNIAWEMRDHQWGNCKQVLMSYRRTAGLVDPQWLVDF